MSNLTADSLGYGFAWFHSHAASGRFQNWFAPDKGAADAFKTRCACEMRYDVSEHQHYHDLNGVCHRPDRCTEAGNIAPGVR